MRSYALAGGSAFSGSVTSREGAMPAGFRADASQIRVDSQIASREPALMAAVSAS